MEQTAFFWNELTILRNDLTIDWNDLTWNDLTMERNDRKSYICVKENDSLQGNPVLTLPKANFFITRGKIF